MAYEPLSSTAHNLQQNRQHVIQEIELSEIDLLYVSPEKLVSEDFTNMIRRIKVALFAIDEAHCISAWGHDFRPEYTQLNFIKKWFQDVPVIALTATADKITRRDIVRAASFRFSSMLCCFPLTVPI